MKNLLVLSFALFAVSFLAAITMDFDGDNLTRAAVFNDTLEVTHGHVDNRLWLGMNADITEGLKMRVNMQFGFVTWGDTLSGGSISNAVDIKAYELYMDYRIDCLQSDIRIGQQWWQDHMGLIINDSFSGIMLTNEDLLGFQTELGWIRALDIDSLNDDDNYFLLNVQSLNPNSFGLLASYGKFGANNNVLTIMPNASFEAGPLYADATAFLGYHFNNAEGDKTGLGGALKANLDLGFVDLGTDLLYSTSNGIAVLSPYYQNGLYIYGINIKHDGLSLYWWDTPYSDNSDTAFSAVGTICVPINDNISVKAAGGYVLDRGKEINCGINFDLIPDTLQLSTYAAFGRHVDNLTDNFAVGTSLEATF